MVDGQISLMFYWGHSMEMSIVLSQAFTEKVQ